MAPIGAIFRCCLHPIGRDAVVIIDLAVVVAEQAVIIAVCEFGTILDLLFGEIDAVAIQFFVVMQLFPWQWIVVVTNTEEAAKAQNGVGDTTAALFKNDALDRADLLAVSAVDAGAFDLVTGNEAWRVLDVWIAACLRV